MAVSNPNPKREPRGIPSGGQYAADVRPESPSKGLGTGDADDAARNEALMPRAQQVGINGDDSAYTITDTGTFADALEVLREDDSIDDRELRQRMASVADKRRANPATFDQHAGVDPYDAARADARDLAHEITGRLDDGDSVDEDEFFETYYADEDNGCAREMGIDDIERHMTQTPEGQRCIRQDFEPPYDDDPYDY